jgi:hypothetical protein
MPLSSTPTVVNTVVFPLNGVQAQPPKRPTVMSQAVNRSATY